MSHPIYVGYDPREELAYQVCEYSLQKHSQNSCQITPLIHRDLRSRGFFNREWLVDSKGQYSDTRDGKPFSTEFSHSRFAMPLVARADGHEGWVMFVDVDFLFLANVADLFRQAKMRPECAVMCVKHSWDSHLDGKKMDGVVQATYPRKLWSSMFLMNLSHPANDWLTAYQLNHATGGDLHRFCWLKDEEIGGVHVEWNWIPGFSTDGVEPKAVHYSFGGPWMTGYEEVPFAEEWRDVYAEMLKEWVDSDHAHEPTRYAR